MTFDANKSRHSINKLVDDISHGQIKRLLAHAGVGTIGGGVVGANVNLNKDKKHGKLRSIAKGVGLGATIGATTGVLHADLFKNKQVKKLHKMENEHWDNVGKAHRAEQASRDAEYAKRSKESQEKWEKSRADFDKAHDDFFKRYGPDGTEYGGKGNHGYGKGSAGFDGFNKRSQDSGSRGSYERRQKPLADLAKEHGIDLKSKADLKAWYRSKSKAHHPDKHMQAPEAVRKDHEEKFKAATKIKEAIESHSDYSKMASIKQEGLYADPEYVRVQKKYSEGNLEDRFQYRAYKRALDRAVYNYHTKQGH